MNESELRYQVGAIIDNQLQILRENIIANSFAAGQKATGKTADSMTVRIFKEGDIVVGELDARAFFGNLEQGNKPFGAQHFRYRADGTTYPSAPKWFTEIIREWAEAKHLDFESPWAVATKIMTEGTELYRNGGRDDIFTPEIPKALKELQRRLAGLFDVQITATIFETLRQN